MLFLTPLPQRLDTGATPTFAGITGSNGQTILGNSSGAWAIAASGTNQNITLTPSGSGYVDIVSANAYGINLNTAASAAMVSRIGCAQGALQVGVDASGNGNVRTETAARALLFSNSGAEMARFHLTTGRFGIGTGNTDSGALLQVGTDTSNAAGGMVFGANTQLYRSGEGLNLKDTTLANVGIRFLNNSGSACRVQMDTTYNLTLNSESGSVVLKSAGTTALTLDSSQNATFAGTVKPQLATTAGAPAYVKGAIYFDTTLNKLRVGGASAWETITSV
jgi:hypothetical protein